MFIAVWRAKDSLGMNEIETFDNAEKLEKVLSHMSYSHAEIFNRWLETNSPSPLVFMFNDKEAAGKIYRVKVTATISI